jgi:hypothetical protein
MPPALRNTPPMRIDPVEAIEWTSSSTFGLNAVALLFGAYVIVPVAGVVGLPAIGNVKCVASTMVIGPMDFVVVAGRGRPQS